MARWVNLILRSAHFAGYKWRWCWILLTCWIYSFTWSKCLARQYETHQAAISIFLPVKFKHFEVPWAFVPKYVEYLNIRKWYLNIYPAIENLNIWNILAPYLAFFGRVCGRFWFLCNLFFTFPFKVTFYKASSGSLDPVPNPSPS